MQTGTYPDLPTAAPQARRRRELIRVMLRRMVSGRYRQQHWQMIRKMHVSENLGLNMVDIFGAKKEIEWTPGVTCRKGFAVWRADDSEICFFEKPIQFLASAEIVEIPADNGAFLSGNELRNLLKLLLPHGSMEREVPDEEGEILAHLHIVEELFHPMAKLPYGAGETIHREDAVAVIPKEGEALEDASLAVLGVHVPASVRCEGLEKQGIMVHLEKAANIRLHGGHEHLKPFVDALEYPLRRMEVVPGFREVAPQRPIETRPVSEVEEQNAMGVHLILLYNINDFIANSQRIAKML